MTTEPSGTFRSPPRLAGVFAIAVGVLVMIGWTVDVEFLKGAGRITMKPNAAVALMACGLALVAVGASSAHAAVAGVPAAALAALIGALTLSQHLLGWDLGIDQLLFAEAPGAPATASPARMGLNASASFMLTGTALLALFRRRERAAVLAQWLAVISMALATIAIVGYLYGALELYSIARYTGIAWPTSLTLLVIAVGTFFARSDVGPASILLSPGPGGLMARRMLALAIPFPIVLGYLRVVGERARLYDTGLGSALIAAITIGVFAAAIWRTALKLDATNRLRAAAQSERDELLVRERAAREEAERASRLKDEFLATLSHELRTPLNVILGWGETLRSNAVVEDRRRHAAEMVVRNARVLARLVEDLLDVSRISNARVHLALQPVDLVQVATTAILAADAAASARSLRLISRLGGQSAIVAGDPERLQQVVGNLLSNAIKFTAQGGTIEVAARVHDSTIELQVSDTGQGISPQFLPHVFERFRQEDATSTREHGGLGLGLSIVRELTELHGGSVSASSDGPGRGATFTVTLPLLKTPQPVIN